MGRNAPRKRLKKVRGASSNRVRKQWPFSGYSGRCGGKKCNTFNDYT